MLNLFKFLRGISMVPKATTEIDELGELEVLNTTNKMNFHNGTSASPVVTESHAATLTNKTIDADTNTISNLEVDNLKTGVLNTDLNAGTATDTEIPSALAVQEYISSGAQTDIDDLVTLTGVPVNSTDLGPFTGSILSDDETIKSAIQELETFAENDAADLQDHIDNPTGAHEASAISVTPVGNLDADNAQAAFEEHQADIDNRPTIAEVDSAVGAVQTDIDNHIADTTGAHAGSAISNTPSGNLSATTVQGAVNELQSDIDTRIAGPASSTDDTLVVYSGTTGKLAKASAVTLNGSNQMGNLALVTSTAANIQQVNVTGAINESQYNDSTTTGSNQTLTLSNGPFTVLSNASLLSIDGITAGTAGKNHTIVNRTGNSITINNDSGVTVNRILTGTKSNLSLADQASILLKYDGTNAYWNIIGGSGSGGGSSLDTIFQLTGLDAATWLKGHNATFLGGGVFAGTFVSNTTNPLQNTADYKFTQAAGSLTDYISAPAQTIDPRFRGQNVTLYFPYTYNGNNNDIEVMFYDNTNAAIIPSSVFIQASTTVGIFKTNIVIPSTCDSLYVGFQVRVLNSGKVFEFDSVQMTSDTTVYASISNDTPTTTFSPTSTWVTNATHTGKWYRDGEYMVVTTNIATTGAPTATQLILNLPSGYTIDTTKLVSATAGNIQIGNATYIDTAVNGYSGGVYYNTITSVLAYYGIASATNSTLGGVTASQPFSFGAGDNLSFEYKVPIVGWTTTNTNILTAPDTFSTDTAPLVYASSATYTLATLANAPVGTFITYAYTINTVGTKVQTTVAPTQTVADMSVNGILLTNRVYAAASTPQLPASIAIQIGKGLKGVTISLYKSSGKVVSGEIDFFVNSTSQQGGLWNKSYNESTGILTIDVGAVITSSVTSNINIFADGSSQTSGYLVINASKNPALTGLNISAVAARGVQTSGQSIPNTGFTTITYDATKTYDTNGALNSATGIFTAPESGYYQVSARVIFTNQNYLIGNIAYLQLIKNGSATPSALGTLFIAERGVPYEADSLLSTGINLIKGETLSIQVNNNRNAGASTVGTPAGYNYFSVHKTNIG